MTADFSQQPDRATSASSSAASSTSRLLPERLRVFAA